MEILVHEMAKRVAAEYKGNDANDRRKHSEH